MTDNFSFLSASVKAFHMNDSLIQVFWTNMNNFKLISSFLEIDFEINISDKKSRRFDLSEVIFKCIKVL